MSVHVLLNKFGKSDKMRGLPFCKKFNKFNITGAQMFDSILSYGVKIIL